MGGYIASPPLLYHLSVLGRIRCIA